MHSPRQKKDRSEQADPKWPTHSQMGNPYPPGLEPHVIKYEPPDKPNRWPQPLDPEKVPRPPTGFIVVEGYRYQTPLPEIPRLKVRIAPRGPNLTDEQWDMCQRIAERNTLQHAMYLHMCRLLCTDVGNHLTCPEGACRPQGLLLRHARRGPLLAAARRLPALRAARPRDHRDYRQEITAQLKRAMAREVK